MKKKLLQPLHTPGTSTGSGSHSGFLPEDLMLEAANRLYWVCMVYAFGFMAAYFPGYTLAVLDGVPWFGVSLYTAIISILTAFFVGVTARKRWVCPEKIILLGLVFEVVGAFGIGFSERWGMFSPIALDMETFYVGISWVCPWIVVFPMILPSRPRWGITASLLAASTGPLAMYAAWFYQGQPPLPDSVGTSNLILMFIPNYICVGMAGMACRIVHGFSRHVQKAREMGSYRMVALLGRGGMGEVWMAEHQMLARPAAIKIIRTDRLGGGDAASAQNTIRRFEREAHATAALHSPHSIDLYDFGTTNDGSFYYVMELLDGLNMEDLVKRFGPLPAARTSYLLKQACHSLLDAHRGGLIHRDIKPANLFVCRYGFDHDFVKILDFGLVKNAEENTTPDTQLTMEGVASGTPAYIAPEMALGKKTITGQADIYALGCVGYWLLTGHLVFEGETPMEMLIQHAKETPVPPSQRTELPIPESMERTILSCLEKDPEKRPDGADELRRMLIASVDEASWTGEHAVKWWQSHIPSPEFWGRDKSRIVTPDLGAE